MQILPLNMKSSIYFIMFSWSNFKIRKFFISGYSSNSLSFDTEWFESFNAKLLNLKNFNFNKIKGSD